MKHARAPSRALARALPTSALLVLVGGALTLGAGPVAGQGSGPGVSFSIDYVGPTISQFECSGIGLITEGDLLQVCDPLAIGEPVFGPLPPPFLHISAGFGPPLPGLALPMHMVCYGHPPGVPCGIEVDALSYGQDGLLDMVDYFAGKVYFSVDRCAAGVAGSLAFPNADSEGAVNSLEPEADAFTSLFLPLSIFPPPVAFGDNTGMIDGNGLVSAPSLQASGAAYPGLGLVERFPFPIPGPYDNVDALDTEGPLPGGFPPTGVYFSLDNLVIDPCMAAMGFAPSNSAALNSPFPGAFVGGDVLWTPAPGMAPAVYAPAVMLGLDLAGPDTDDLDALVLVENGINGYQPSQEPYDWLFAGTDMLLFSVRRGSAVIGMPDSLRGLPIEEGDVLAPPLFGVGPPIVLIPAELLGLGTARMGFQGQFPDDLDGLDVRREEPVLYTHGACYGTTGSCPCGNDSPTTGCVNSTGQGGILRPSGTSSVAADNLLLSASQLSLNDQGLFYMGDAIVNAPLWDGLQCALGNTWRFLNSIQNTGPAGTMFMGPGIAASSMGLIVPGTTWYFQAWHRDVMPLGPCGTGANFSHAIGVLYMP